MTASRAKAHGELEAAPALMKHALLTPIRWRIVWLRRFSHPADLTLPPRKPDDIVAIFV